MFVEFPLEENPNRILNRPVVVLDKNLLGVLSVKITKHKARKEDPYDIPIIYWEEIRCKLILEKMENHTVFLFPKKKCVLY